MSWFLAKIVYRIVCGNGHHTPQFDEQLRLIEALHETDAFSKAQLIGELEQEVFMNDRQHLVQWQFINVSELIKISALVDGAELYSRVHETDHAGLYIEHVHKKAGNIQSNIRERCTESF